MYMLNMIGELGGQMMMLMFWRRRRIIRPTQLSMLWHMQLLKVMKILIAQAVKNQNYIMS